MPKKKIGIKPPENGFNPFHRIEYLTYEISLLTPMVGGGVKSWIADRSAPIRIPSVKGHLRFWWRTMQNGNQNASTLHDLEKTLWGGTNSASLVHISLRHHNEVIANRLQRGANGMMDYDSYPGYVLFPLQGQTDMNHFDLIQECSFMLTIHCPAAYRDEVDRSVRLWVLFGGIGARTRRGCGSLYCSEIMNEYQTPQSISDFLHQFGNEPALSTAPYPQLNGADFRYRIINNNDAIRAWTTFLNRYKDFRQGVDCGRNPGMGNRPGRTRWPEADAIRRITGRAADHHQPEHPAINWFPRGSYGLPIQTEFRNDRSEPQGKFMLEPVTGERWPSPVILKITKLGSGQLIETCMILNARVPAQLKLSNAGQLLHNLTANEMPLASTGKTMPVPGPILTDQNPYDGLIRHLGL